MKSIRTRLTLFFLLICVGCLAIAMAVSSIFSRSALTDTNDRLHEQQAEYYASMIDSWLQENTGDVDAACTFLEAKSLIDEVTIRPVMEQYTNQCHLVSNQDMLDLLLDRALVMLLLP